MAKVPCHNPGSSPRHVGGVMVMPGQTRMVEESDLGIVAATKPEPKPSDPLLVLLDLSVPNFTSTLAGLVVDGEIDQQALDRLTAAEAAGVARKGIAAVLEESTLQLAARETRLTATLKSLESAESGQAYTSAIEAEDDPVIIRVLTASRDEVFPPTPDQEPTPDQAPAADKDGQ